MYKHLAICLLCGTFAAGCPTDDSAAIGFILGGDHKENGGNGPPDNSSNSFSEVNDSGNSDVYVRNDSESKSTVKKSGNSEIRNSGNSESYSGSRSYSGSEQDQEQYQGQENYQGQETDQDQNQTVVFAPVTTVEAPDLDPIEDAAKKHAERAADAPAVSEGGAGDTPCGDTKTAGVQTGPLGVFFGGTSFTCAEYRLDLLKEEVGDTKGFKAARVVHYATLPLRVVCAFATAGLLCN